MNKIIKNTWKITCYPLLYMVIQTMVSYAYMFVLGVIIGIEEGLTGVYLTTEEAVLLVQARMEHGVTTIISVTILFLIIYSKLKKEWKINAFWSFNKIKTTYIILYFVLGFALNITMIGVLNMLPESLTQQPIDGLIGNNIILELVSIALFAPVLEEIIYRSIIQKHLIKIMKLPVALVLQALIFALVHFSFVQGTYAFILGIIVGLVYIWSGSIWSAIIVHVAFNATSVVMTNILGDAEINLVYFGISAVAGLAISIVCMVVLAKKRIVIDNIDMEIEEEVVATENV